MTIYQISFVKSKKIIIFFVNNASVDGNEISPHLLFMSRISCNSVGKIEYTSQSRLAPTQNPCQPLNVPLVLDS
jgi:hypothetical protein